MPPPALFSRAELVGRRFDGYTPSPAPEPPPDAAADAAGTLRAASSGATSAARWRPPQERKRPRQRPHAESASQRALRTALRERAAATEERRPSATPPRVRRHDQAGARRMTWSKLRGGGGRKVPKAPPPGAPRRAPSMTKGFSCDPLSPAAVRTVPIKPSDASIREAVTSSLSTAISVTQTAPVSTIEERENSEENAS